MYLGRKINSFSAEDSGIVAPSVQAKRIAARVEATPKAVEVPLELTTSEATVELKSSLDAAEREQRLWGLVGRLRAANARLFKDKLRLTKEVEAYRSDASHGQLTVTSILEAAPERDSVRS